MGELLRGDVLELLDGRLVARHEHRVVDQEAARPQAEDSDDSAGYDVDVLPRDKPVVIPRGRIRYAG